MIDEPSFDPRRKSAIRELIVSTARTSPTRRGRGTHTAIIASLVVLAVGISGGVAYALGTGLLEPNPVASVAPTPSDTSSPDPAPTASPTATTEPMPTPTPSAETLDPGDPGTWVIGFDGVGPVKLGTSLESQRQALPAFEDITEPVCVGSYLDLQAPNGFSLLFVGGINEPTLTAAITFAASGPSTRDGSATAPKTIAGIGIGSTKAELLTAYPDIERTGFYQSDDYPFYGLTDGNGGWIVFGIIDDRVARIQIANEATLPLENRSVKTLPSERCPA